ncbi:MAG: hypothetical protein IT332_09040 [Ardenticatenales bacterium]|nr:hypothetical protein [Ardenticatenales bacterium]
MIRTVVSRPLRSGAALAAMLAAACQAGPAPTPTPAGGGSAPTTGFSPAANATLAAVRDAPDIAHQCTTEARQALQSLARQYPAEPLVRQAARAIMPACRDQASLAELLSAVPRDARTRDEQLDLVRLYLRSLSRFADAEVEVKPLVDADPNNTDTLSLYASALYYQGRFAEALPLVDRRWTVLVREGNTDIMTMRADQLLKDGRVDRADAVLREVLSMNPSHMFAINTLRQVRVLQDDEAGAAQLAATAEAIDSQIGMRERAMAEANERFQDLVTAFDAADYTTAEQIARELLENAVDDGMRADLYTSLASIYRMQGRSDAALEARDQASHYEELTRQGQANQTPTEPAAAPTSSLP